MSLMNIGGICMARAFFTLPLPMSKKNRRGANSPVPSSTMIAVPDWLRVGGHGVLIDLEGDGGRVELDLLAVDEHLGGLQLFEASLEFVDDFSARVGVVGELCIGGDGISSGYLKNEELTNLKFIDNPFNLNEKIYRTGDLCTWLNNGEVEYLGRIDNQVKIKGYRIELGEIENVTP